MLAREHLDDEAADAPDIGFEGVRLLLHDLGRHPEHRALQGRPVCAVTREQI